MQSQVQGMVARPSGALAGYDPAGYFCEFAHSAAVSECGRLISTRLDELGLEELTHRARAAEAELYNQGITFTVYSEDDAIDRILPFDVIPRLITAGGLGRDRERRAPACTALNLFLADVYGPQKVLKDGLMPPELVLGNANFRAEMRGSPCRTAPMSTSTASISSATARASSACSRTMAARRQACPTWSRTAT